MILFRLDSALERPRSVSRRLGDVFEDAWQAAGVAAGHEPAVTRRDLGAQPVPHLTAIEHEAASVPRAERAHPQKVALSISTQLVNELYQSDAYLFTVGLYNFGVPSALKAWADHLLLDPGLSGTSQALAGRPAAVLLARGGDYGPGRPRHGWDHAEPWLQHILGGMLGLDLQVVAAELTLAQANPALSHLKDRSDASLADAEAAASKLGAAFAERVASS